MSRFFSLLVVEKPMKSEIYLVRTASIPDQNCNRADSINSERRSLVQCLVSIHISVKNREERRATGVEAVHIAVNLTKTKYRNIQDVHLEELTSFYLRNDFFGDNCKR